MTTPHALTPAVLAAMNNSVLCWLATCGADGWPNVSPKEVFAALDDDHLVIAHIASPNSARHIDANPRVCVSFIDVWTQKGYKLRGEASVVRPDDPCFATVSAPLQALMGGRFALRAVFLVRVTATEPVVAPSYRFYPDTTEAAQVAAARRAYGVDDPARRNG